jgi:putative tricarboxylic transport membrane protein
MATMKRPYQVTATVLLVLSALVGIESLKLKYYTPLGPGPGFFPFWLSLGLAALAVAMFCQATFRPAEPRPEGFRGSRLGYLRALAMCAAWAWAVAMLERLGFRLTMAVFFPFLLLALGRVRWHLVVAVSLIGSLAVYYVFTQALSVPLPIGPFDGIFEPIDSLFH